MGEVSVGRVSRALTSASDQLALAHAANLRVISPVSLFFLEPWSERIKF